MPKASPLQPSFAGGEFSPRVYGRVDNERYKTGAAKLENWIPTLQGPIIRRPGMKYVGNDVKDPSKPPAFIPFQFSQTQNYVLEFGDKYLRFYTNNTLITSNTTVNYAQLISTTFGSSFPTYTARDVGMVRLGESVNPDEVFPFNPTVGGILEVETPYSYPDVNNLKWAQKEDTLFLFCSSYPTFKLVRGGNLSWDLSRAVFSDGPYLPLNSYREIGDSSKFSIVLREVSLSSDGATFPMRYLLASSGPRLQIRNVQTSFLDPTLIRITTELPHPFYTGDRVVIEGVEGTTEANNGTSTITGMSWPVRRITSTVFDLQGSARVNALTGTSIATAYPALFQPLVGGGWADTGRTVGLYGANGNRIWAKITDVIHMGRIKLAVSEADGAATALATDSFFLNSTAFFWQMEPYNYKHGYPSTGCFHQDRLAMAGAPAFPQRVDLSRTSNYQNFAPSNSTQIVTDSHSVQVGLASEQINKINWLKTDTQGLLAGSFSSEWNIAPNNQAAALTPTNVNAKQTSFFGSHDADAVQTGNATLYIQKGQQRLREMNYFFQVDTYRSTDIAELADHLMAPGLTKIANQRELIPIVWALTSEGKLRSMTYSRDDAALKVAWAPHVLGGQSDSAGTAPVVKTMAVIPSADGTFDQIWCAVQRFVNGTSVVSIEYSSRLFDETVVQEDAICLDMSGTYDVPISIRGITRAGSAILTTQVTNGLADGDQILIKEVIGCNSSTVDATGVIYNSNLVNYRVFRVGAPAGSSFFLQDINNGSSYVDSRAYSAYFSNGEVRKMVQNITGLTWLKNETVSVLADGKIHNNVVVNSAGVIALDYKAATVQVGYGYNSDGKTLRPEAGSADGTSIGKKRRPYKAAFMLHRSGPMYMGPSFERLTTLNYDPLGDQPADTATPLFSGMVRESIESEHNFEGQVCFRQNSPLPGMLQTVTVMLETNDA